MDYGRAYLFFLRKPKTGLKNVLLSTVITLIPAIGPIIFLGYMVVLGECLLRDEKREAHSDFSLDRFPDYLRLGIWPFVTILLFSLLIILPIYIILAGATIRISLSLGKPIMIPILIGLLGLIFFFLISYLIGPMLLYSQKYQILDIKGAFWFVINFIKILGFSYMIVVIVSMMLNFLITLIDFLCCIIGIFPANMVSQVAHEHILIQLYDKYLILGGRPLPSVELSPELIFKPTDLTEPQNFSEEQTNYDDPQFR